MSDSDFSKNKDDRKSVSGMVTFLNGSVVAFKSSTQKVVTLSVTEAALYAATMCAQDMLFVMHLIESLGLKLEKPMILKVDNKGAVDLINNWSVGGRTRHIEVRQYFLRNLKEDGVIETSWISGDDNTADIFTKNLGGPDHRKHAGVFYGTTASNA